MRVLAQTVLLCGITTLLAACAGNPTPPPTSPCPPYMHAFALQQ